MLKIRFIDRELKSLVYNASAGPAESQRAMSYSLNVSEPVAGEKDVATVDVVAALMPDKGRKPRGGKEAPTPEPFLRLEMALKFDLKKLTKAERADLKGFTEVFEAYAGSLCAEVISGVLMHTPFRMPNFPR